MAAMVVYSHVNFTGEASPHQTHDRENIGDFWNDKISSIKITGGERWQFFRDINYGGPSVTLGPGSYPVLPRDTGFPNDWVSSFKRVA